MASVPFTKWFMCKYITTIFKSLSSGCSRESCGNPHLMEKVSELNLFVGKNYLRFSR